MSAIVFLFALPLFGWWLVRTTRSFDQLAKVLNTHDTNLGFIGSSGHMSSFVLFSNVTFVWWLIRRGYETISVSTDVHSALAVARKSYLSMVVGMVVLLASASLTIFSSN